MTGKLAIRFSLPNLGRLRARLVNPSETLSSDLRAELARIAAEQLNKANLVIRAEFIDYVAKRDDIVFKSKEHQEQVYNLTGSIFDSVFATDAAALALLTGVKSDKDAEETNDGEGKDETEANGAEAKEAPKATKAEAKEAPKATKAEAKEAPKATKAETAAPVDDDEFGS